MSSPQEKKVGKFKCSLCSSIYNQRKNLFSHLRKKHNLEPEVDGKIQCPLCEEKFRQHADLRQHLETLHLIEIEREEQHFPDNEAFESWKSRYELSTGYHYVTRISEKAGKNGVTKCHYICHRSGIFISSSTYNERKKKIVTNKIGKVCPSVMNVSKSLSDGTIFLNFYKTHIGHEPDLKRTPKKKSPKNYDSINYDVCVVIPAAGIGERMAMELPKQFIPIHEKPIICYTVDAFLRISFIKKIVVVASSQNLDLMLNTLSKTCSPREEKLLVTESSGSRHQSIDSGLKALKTNPPEVVVVHDGVRPFISEEIVYNVVSAAKEHSAAGVVCPLTSTVVSVNKNGFLECSLDRDKHKASEMPQAFLFDVICKAYEECSSHDLEFGTECLHLVEKYCNIQAKLLPGATNLWKITHRKDIYTATACIKENQSVSIVNSQIAEDFAFQLRSALGKAFRSVNLINKNSESLILTSSNLVYLWNNKSTSNIISQLVALHSPIITSELLPVTHIVMDVCDENLNLLEAQKQMKHVAKELKLFKIIVYLILFQCHTTETYKEAVDMTTSLLFNCNPSISGSIFCIF